MKNPKLGFTKHAKERFAERFPKKVVDGDVIRSLLNEYQKAEPTKMFMNNTSFMVYMYETYGYDKDYTFYINDDIVFVSESGNLLTVYDRSDSIFGSKSSGFRSKNK